jgi:hypothetical protein
MPTVAEIYDKGPGEHTLILSRRCALTYPFEVPTWTDLRVGFFLSVTDDTADDTTTGLAETIDVPQLVIPPPENYWWCGIKTNNDLQPTTGNNTGFIGFSNWQNANRALPDSILVSSDAGIGAGPAFWRPKNEFRDSYSALIHDTGRAIFFSNVQPHFPQDTATVAAGYATLLMLRIQRPTPASRALTVTIKQGTTSGDVLFSNDPSLDRLETNMASYPSVVQSHSTLGDMINIPNALYLYWPFSNSRIRCHALGFMKFH